MIGWVKVCEILKNIPLRLCCCSLLFVELLFLVSIVVCFSLVVFGLSSLVSIAGTFLLLFLVLLFMVSIVGAFLFCSWCCCSLFLFWV